MSGDSWNVRTTSNPVIRGAGRVLTRLNDRHPWDHNAHFHPWIRRSLPEGTARVLDVGCGRGALIEALAGACGPAARIEGIDPDAEMARSAAERCADDPRVRIHRRTLAEHAVHPDLQGTYDALTMVASLHHQELGPALAQARDLLRPGGRLLVVTLARADTVLDHAWEIGNSLTNPVIGVLRHPRPVRAPQAGPRIPVAAPAWSLGELRRSAEAVIPGAIIRRRQGFRATLAWRKPG